MRNILFILILLSTFGCNTLFAADAEFRCQHGQQHALVLGTVESIEDNLYIINVAEALPCARLGMRWDDYNMLPLDKIPSTINARIDNPQYDLLTDSCRVGDVIVISLGKDWQRQWQMLKVTDTDKGQLKVWCDDDRRPDAVGWTIFIRSGAQKVVQGYGDDYVRFTLYNEKGERTGEEDVEISKRIEELFTISSADFNSFTPSTTAIGESSGNDVMLKPLIKWLLVGSGVVMLVAIVVLRKLGKRKR